MIPSLNHRYVALAGLFLLFEWSWVLLGRRANISRPPLPLRPALQTPHKNDIFDFPPVDSEAIRSICANTEWNDDAIFTCDNSVGGIGNVQNSILICVRFAIAAGGSLVVPRIIVRNAQDISKIRTGQRTEMSYMFDRKHFVDSLALSCPGLRLYDTIESIPNRAEIGGPIPLQPEDLQPPSPGTGIPKPESWPSDFRAWLVRETGGTSSGGPTTLVELGRSYLIYPIYSDGTNFAHQFGSILKFRPDVRVLATTTFRRLLEEFKIEYNEKNPSAITENAYFGAHLRTEKDAVEGWPAPDWVYSRYTTQSAAYLNQSIAANLSVIYVTSGNLTEVTRLASDASRYNIRVTTKHELLPPADLQQLNELAWDQQGLVDFLVMLKASDFAGIAHSSFAWSIALKRHLSARRKDRKLHLQGPQMLSDELSQIYGMVAQYPEYAACVWP